MSRARLVLAAMVVCACGGAATAQTVTAPEGWVVLPVDEYRALREKALPPDAPPPGPPVEATLTRVDYELRVEGDSIAGRALLTIDVLREGWARVQIPSGLLVRDARLEGQPLPLVEGPPPHVLLSRAGRSVLTLDIVLRLDASAGTESLSLPPSLAPISRAALVLPRGGVDLTVAGGFVAEHTEAANENRWIAFGRPNQPLVLSWKRRADDRRAEQPLRVRARVTEMVTLGEDASQMIATVRVEVIQGLTREITVALPPGLIVNQVDGATVADWQTGTGTLNVRLLEPVATAVSFVVHAEARSTRDGAIGVPLVRVPSAERETGGIAVDVVGAGEIGAPQTRGFEPADPSELGDIVAGRESPSMVAFRHKPLTGTDVRSLTVNVVRYTPQPVLIANIEEARYRALASEDGRLLVQASYAIRNNQRSFLKVTMPAGAAVWSATVAGRPIRAGLAESDAVLLPLEKGRATEEAPTFVVELTYLQRIDAWDGRERARIDLPAVDLPVSRTALNFHYSPRYRIEPQPGAFRLDTDPGPFAEALQAPAAPAANLKGREKSGDRAAAGLQALVDRFRNEPGGRTVVGSLPVTIAFPAFGPSIFLASELTAEGRAPSVELVIRRARS